MVRMPATPPDDRTRFAQLLEEHRGILFAVANGYCRNRDDRGDLVQDILVQLWRGFPRFDGRCRFSTWMYRVALNVAISAHRSAGRRTHEAVDLEDVGLELASADLVIESASDDARLLQRLITALEAPDRALVILYVEGYTHQEMAEILGISATNASTRVSRLKERLRREVEAIQGGRPDETR
jgi:RNA polymerase sigma factor (sigma-70 family)